MIAQSMELLFALATLTTTGHLSHALLHRSPVKLASSASSNSRRGTSHARLVRMQAPPALEDGASVLRGSGGPLTAAACSVRRERFLPRTPLPATGARRTRASPRGARPWRAARATRATLGPTADRALHAWKIRTKIPREASPAWSVRNLPSRCGTERTAGAPRGTLDSMAGRARRALQGRTRARRGARRAPAVPRILSPTARPPAAVNAQEDVR
jgi:hypothetical protein